MEAGCGEFCGERAGRGVEVGQFGRFADQLGVVVVRSKVERVRPVQAGLGIIGQTVQDGFVMNQGTKLPPSEHLQMERIIVIALDTMYISIL